MTRNRLAISTLEPTRYEVAIVKAGETVAVLGFTARKTKATLMAYARDNGARIASLLTEAELDADYVATRDAISFGSVSVTFTGRTERDAAS